MELELLLEIKNFMTEFDLIAEVQMCYFYHESHVGIQVRNTNTGPLCVRCLREGTNHRIPGRNHMDPGTQPHVLEVLTQVEDMLIVCVSPISQVMHSICCQYKYQGHTISFMQEVKDISNTFPRHINNLDLVVIVQKKG